jgi:hypothetical protein
MSSGNEFISPSSPLIKRLYRWAARGRVVSALLSDTREAMNGKYPHAARSPPVRKFAVGRASQGFCVRRRGGGSEHEHPTPGPSRGQACRPSPPGTAECPGHFRRLCRRRRLARSADMGRPAAGSVAPGEPQSLLRYHVSRRAPRGARWDGRARLARPVSAPGVGSALDGRRCCDQKVSRSRWSWSRSGPLARCTGCR